MRKSKQETWLNQFADTGTSFLFGRLAPAASGGLTKGRTADAPGTGSRADGPDTGILPSADEPPPGNPGGGSVSVSEAAACRAARQLGYTWYRWRRRHQARARYHHCQTRLRASPA